jgi:circadian clock protein KaiC
LTARKEIDRVHTGSSETDRILGGGFLRNSINIVMGQPGTGKTILVQHLVFHNASNDRPILYLTTLSEPLPKIVKYLQQFDFYDESQLGESIHYEDVGPRLAADGIKALLPVVDNAIRTLAPKIVIIDSFKALHDLAPSITEMRQMLYELTGVLTAYDTTTFLLGEYTEEHSRQLPEFAIADGIIELSRNFTSTREERFLRVLKLRGSSYIEGQHGFKIAPGGLDVYPRLLSPDVPADYKIVQERTSWGVPGLDALLGGGLWRGSTTLLAGPAGAGKTTMALQFALEGVRAGEPTLYVNFQENPTQLARAIHNLGSDVEQAKKDGLKLLYASPVELQIDSLVVTIFRRIRQENIRRVVLDAAGDLIMAASDSQRLHDYLYALVQHFTVAGVTSVLTYETAGGVTDAGGGTGLGGRFSYMSDNIVWIRIDVSEVVRRSVLVLKARGSAHDLHAHELQMSASGARVV